MRRFLITSDKFKGIAELQYNDADLLCKIDCMQTSMAAETITAFKAAVPAQLEHLLSGKHFSAATTIIESGYEITFEMFWKKYNNKINKKRCLPLWNKTSKVKQVKAYHAIDVYNKFLAKNSWRNKADPENYLRNEMYENEYK